MRETRETGADLVITSLRQAVKQIAGAARDAARDVPAAADRRADVGIMAVAS